MKTLILIPYFGDWPAWFDYFLLSCNHNKHITWQIFSDAPRLVDCPDNVVIEKMTLDDFNSLASKKLGMDIKINMPYKICDLRPAFGTIFSDYLREYNFWGYSDLDLVYGDLLNFITEEILESHDVISCRKEYQTGHFAIYRNIEKVNKLYKLSDVHKNVFQNNSKHYAFDERSNLYGRRLFGDELPDFVKRFYSSSELFWNKLRYKLNSKNPGKLRDINSITSFAEHMGKLRLYREDIVMSDLWYRKNKQFDWEITWKDGKLFDPRTSEELLHFHFLYSKHEAGFRVGPIGKSNSFTITAGGIQPA